MTGIVLGSGVVAGILLRGLGLPPAACAAVAFAIFGCSLILPARRYRVAGTLVLLLMMAGSWRAGSPPPPVPDVLPGAESYRGEVRDVPRHYPAHTRAVVELLEPAEATVEVLLPPYPVVRQGDVIAFRGDFQPRGAAGGGRPARARDAAGTVTAWSATVVGSEANWLVRLRQRLTDGLVGRVRRHIPEPAGGLTVGMLTGDDTGMASGTRQAFRAAGLSHITAVSGWNLVLVGGLVTALARRGRLARDVRLPLALATIWGFTLLVGMPPSAIRAAVMASLAIVAQWRGRPAETVTALTTACAVILLITPDLWRDLGFQLSVAATLGIALVGELSPEPVRWRDALAVPFVAELAVTPLLLHSLGVFSLVGPMANVLAAPLIPLVMAGGVAVLVASFVHPVLADAAGLLAWLPGRVLVLIAESAARVDWAWGATPTLSTAGMLVSYAALAAVYWLLRPSMPARERAASPPTV